MSKAKKYSCPNCSKKVEIFLNSDVPRCTKCSIKMILKSKEPAPVAVVEAVPVAEQKGLF